MRKMARKVPLPTEVRPITKPVPAPIATVESLRFHDSGMFSLRCCLSIFMTTRMTSKTETGDQGRTQGAVEDAVEHLAVVVLEVVDQAAPTRPTGMLPAASQSERGRSTDPCLQCRQAPNHFVTAA